MLTVKVNGIFADYDTSPKQSLEPSWGAGLDSCQIPYSSQCFRNPLLHMRVLRDSIRTIQKNEYDWRALDYINLHFGRVPLARASELLCLAWDGSIPTDWVRICERSWTRASSGCTPGVGSENRTARYQPSSYFRWLPNVRPCSRIPIDEPQLPKPQQTPGNSTFELGLAWRPPR